MTDEDRAGFEECAILVGQRLGSSWCGTLQQWRAGQAASVEFDWAWVLEREERCGDVLGFYHTHPEGLATPSDRDARTMRAWVSCCGRPMLCLIDTGSELSAYLFSSDEGDGLPLSDVLREGYSIQATVTWLQNPHAEDSADA